MQVWNINAYMWNVNPYMWNVNPYMWNVTSVYDVSTFSQNRGQNIDIQLCILYTLNATKLYSGGLLSKNFLWRRHWWIGCFAQQIIQEKTNWQIKLWQVGHTLPNPSQFSPVKVLCYTASYMVAI